MTPRVTWIVVYDNDETTTPMGWDKDCDGALCAYMFAKDKAVAVFDAYKDARAQTAKRGSRVTTLDLHAKQVGELLQIYRACSPTTLQHTGR